MIHELFEHQAAARPGATALIHRDERVSYAQLDGWADRLAHRLTGQGVRRGTVAGICVPRGPAMVAAILAVLKTGAGYLMLDPGLPEQRRRDMAEDAEVCTVLTAQDVTDEPGPRLARGSARSGPDDVACVMFTSGSTGRPKAVLMPHRAVTGTLTGQDYLPFEPAAVWLQCAPVSWDAFALELWGALLFGGTCVLYPGPRPDPVVIGRLVATSGVTAMYLSSGLFNVIVDECPEALDGVRRLVVGGEAMSPAHAARALNRHRGLTLRNGYGPVEAMIFVTTHPVTAMDAYPSSVPIGRPLAGKDVRLLDARLDAVRDGEIGEVYAAGTGLALGYRNAAGVTAVRFVADPYGLPGALMYRTGDLARRGPGGVLEFVGRADAQVKIDGYRVEPAEAEAALARHPALRRAAVVAVDTGQGGKRLAGFVVPHGGAAAMPGVAQLRDHLAASLPAYLVPSAFVAMDGLPLTSTGKVDRAALRNAYRAAPAPGTGGRKPGAGLERRLATVWADVLGVPEVGAHDDFFVLGGTSLAAVRAAARISTAERRPVTAAEIFTHPTVAGLAGQLGDTASEAPAPIPRLPRVPRSSTTALRKPPVTGDKEHS